jgi:hypothetical protein
MIDDAIPVFSFPVVRRKKSQGLAVARSCRETMPIAVRVELCGDPD